MGAFKEPHGGTLVDLYLSEGTADAEKQLIQDMPGWNLTPRQLCDLDLVMNGAFSPLRGFLGKKDYESVCADMRLTSGILWPLPVVLDVSKEFADSVKKGEKVALLDPEGVPLAIMTLSDKWEPDLGAEAQQVYGTKDETHPGVHFLMHQNGTVNLGGEVQGLEPPTWYDFKLLRDAPAELRGRFRKLGWRKVVGYHTHQPLHRAQRDLTSKAAREAEANLLIHPVVGNRQLGNSDHFIRVRCYEHILEQYPEQTTQLSLLNMSMRWAGPREAVLQAIVRKNYGCTHFIVELDQASPPTPEEGAAFYDEKAAQALFAKHEKELDIAMVPLSPVVYAENRAEYVAQEDTVAEDVVSNLSDTEFRRRLNEGLEIPEWYSYPKVIEELRNAYPPKHQQGFTVFFTGLSGSGKSTVANALLVKLLEIGTRSVTLLDGDLVRQNLSSELTFSEEHRNLNILRIGYVASEITKNGGVAICAPIAPYAATRQQVRDGISAVGGFLEVHVSTPIEVCEARDRKGLYAKARAGLIKGFTGIDDPYEAPQNAELVLNTAEISADLAAHRVILMLEKMGYIR